jgi:hypothetical protein
VFSGVLIAEEVDGVGDKESWDTTMIDVQTFLEAFFEHVPEICLFQWQSFFSHKNQNSGLGTTLFKCHIIKPYKL